jgi:hypothetical protein
LWHVWKITEVYTGYWWRDVRKETTWNNKMGLQEVGWGGMDWINLSQDRDRWRELVDWVMNLQVS